MLKQSIKEIIQKYENEWLSIPGVEGVGEGDLDKNPCVLIFSSIPANELRKYIPEHIKGYPVIIKESGVFEAQE